MSTVEMALRQRITTLEAALVRIRAWDSFPLQEADATGHRPSFSYNWGSNGQRDYMRNVASEALGLPLVNTCPWCLP